MPWGLKRFHESGQTHFVTFTCYHRLPFLSQPSSKQTVEIALDRIRRCFGLCVYGYVVMPEHVHLLISEPERETIAVAIKSLKQGVSRKLIGTSPRFWQKRYYDFNIRDHEQFVEKLRYIHRNPVTRELCARAEEWEWSSFRHYASGHEERAKIESEWAARKRQRAAGQLASAIELPNTSNSNSPTQAKEA